MWWKPFGPYTLNFHPSLKPTKTPLTTCILPRVNRNSSPSPSLHLSLNHGDRRGTTNDFTYSLVSEQVLWTCMRRKKTLPPHKSLPLMGEIAGVNTASLGRCHHSLKTMARWAEGFHDELNGQVFDLEWNGLCPDVPCPWITNSIPTELLKHTFSHYNSFKIHVHDLFNNLRS